MYAGRRAKNRAHAALCLNCGASIVICNRNHSGLCKTCKGDAGAIHAIIDSAFRRWCASHHVTPVVSGAAIDGAYYEWMAHNYGYATRYTAKTPLQHNA